MGYFTVVLPKPSDFEIRRIEGYRGISTYGVFRVKGDFVPEDGYFLDDFYTKEQAEDFIYKLCTEDGLEKCHEDD